MSESEKKVRVPSQATLITRAFGKLQQAKHAEATAQAARKAAIQKHDGIVAEKAKERASAESALAALTGQGG